MDIVSLKFALLAVAAVFVYYLVGFKYKLVFLVILCCGFIATYSYLLLLYILVYALINYYIGLKIPNSKFKISLFRTGILINLSQLIILKYASFTIDPILHLFDDNINISSLSQIIIPVGVSYLTLQGIGYLISIKMGWEKPEKGILKLLIYLTFFPKFLSGPIERSNHFLPQLKIDHSFDSDQITSGLRIALFGFFKKIVIANQLSPFVTLGYNNLDSASGLSLWMILLIQPLYLYFDFSGYTDIAIGVAKTFGIDLLPNFKRPFLSENVTTFWKRMHISLSLWFNDYVFKQVSFKCRKWGKYASVFAVFITFTLFGIFHGAGWNFMMLGFAQALAINYEFFTKPLRTSLFAKTSGFVRMWLGRMFTYLFFGASLVFFFSLNLSSSFAFFSKILTASQYEGSIFLGNQTGRFLSAIALAAFILLLEVLQEDFSALYEKLNRIWIGNNKISRVMRWSVYYTVIIVMYFYGTKSQQFIYFQF